MILPISSIVANAVPSAAASYAGGGVGAFATAGASKTAAIATLVVLRGGAAATAGAAFDLTRARIRLEGLASYSLTSALLMNAALRVFSSTPKKLKKIKELPEGAERRQALTENVATVIFSTLTVVTIMSGLYTTIVFPLMALYSKTALGMGMDAAYLEFFAAMESVRKLGFDMYLLSLVSFGGSFVASLFLNYKGRMRYAMSGSALMCTLFSWVTIRKILKAASTAIFT